MKEYRLKKALEMMQSRTGNITEIAFDAGFNTPSYFSKCFYKRFGIQPSAYLNLAA
jgi:AraC-like DNA-binding protein